MEKRLKLLNMIRIENLKQSEVENLDKNKHLVIPIGAIEFHGEGLALNTDNKIALGLAEEICKRKNYILAPLVGYGNLSEIGLSVESLAKLIEEVCLTYSNLGFSNINLLNAHGKNAKSLQLVYNNLKDKLNLKIFRWWDFCEDKVPHAGLTETLMAYAINKNLVKLKLDKVNVEKSKKLFEEVIKNILKVV